MNYKAMCLVFGIFSISFLPIAANADKSSYDVISQTAMDEYVPAEIVRMNDKAIELSMKGDHQEAMSLLSEAIAAYPKWATLYFNRASVKESVNLYEESLQYLQIAIAMRPDYPEAFNTKGTIYWKQNKIPEAIEAFSLAIKQRPDYARAYNNRGLVLVDNNRIQDAIDDFLHATTLDDKYSTPHCNLAMVYVKQMKRNDAITSFNNCLIRTSNQSNAQQIRRYIIMLGGKPTK